jgi:hypothetical protein
VADLELLTLNLAQMTKESTNVQLPLQPPLLIADVSGSTSWDEWLSETETKLKELGYRRYVQNHKNEDFCFWKTFKNGEDKIYQIGILFYDFRKYADRAPYANRIGIMYECMVLGEDRIDMCVSKNIDLVEFENMAQTFYGAMSQYCNER